MFFCKRWFYVLLWGLLIFNIGLIWHYWALKNDFHVDEIYSFGHANSTQGAYFIEGIDSYLKDEDVGAIYGKWLPAEMFHNYVTVQKEEQFLYGHIWENLAKGVHPPLYYVALHTVCSFFVDGFSKWFGAGLNILIWFLTLFMLYKLSRLFTGDKFMAWFPVFLFGFSSAGLGMVLYIRMYLLQALLGVCLLYETAKMIQENRADNKRLFLIFLYSALGMLTQYSSVVFSFIAAGTGGGILLLRRNWQLLWRYAATMALSAAALFAVFEPAADVMLHSHRGGQMPERAALFAENFLYLGEKRLLSLAGFFMTELLSFREVYAKALILVLILGGTFLWLCGKRMRAETGFLLAVTLLMGVFLAFMMPVMGVFSGRYFSLLMPGAAVLIVLFVVRIAEGLLCSGKVIYGVVGAFVLLNSYAADFGSRSPFAFRLDETSARFEEAVRGKKLLFKILPKLYCFRGEILYKNSGGVFLTDKECLALVKSEVREADFVLVFVSAVDFCPECVLPRQELCLEDEEMVRYVSRVRIGAADYDWYEVIK